MYYQNQTMMSNFISCTIENGEIYRITGLNEKELVGYDVATCNEALNKAEEYYQMLVDNNIIQKEKTQEEINQELLETIKLMNEEIKSLKEAKKNDRQNSKDAGNKSKSSE